MLTNEQMEIIDKYVNCEYYDKTKLVNYLNLHKVVGNEVFDYVDLKNRKERNRKESHPGILDEKWGYEPVPIDKFVRRIPFYFYAGDENIDDYHETLQDIFISLRRKIATGEIMLEEIYEMLEFMFYEKKISLYDMFSYMTDQTGLVTEQYFLEWVEYLHLIDKLGWDDVTPDNFIVAYNTAREAAGLSPMIFTPEWDARMSNPYYRNGNILEFEGTFPCDEAGNPIMRWIGLKIINGFSIFKCNYNKARHSHLFIKVNPDTIIYYRDEDKDGFYWTQVYAGPLTMEFDFHILKIRRKELRYSQREVAEAIGTNVRTYQKWEHGETQPNGFFLLRLINWLDISDIQETIKYMDE